MNKRNAYIIMALIGIALPSCTIVRQGEIVVKRRLGKIETKTLEEGPKVFNPFLSTIIIVPTRTMNMEVKLNLPSK